MLTPHGVRRVHVCFTGGDTLANNGALGLGDGPGFHVNYSALNRTALDLSMATCQTQIKRLGS